MNKKEKREVRFSSVRRSINEFAVFILNECSAKNRKNAFRSAKTVKKVFLKHKRLAINANKNSIKD